MESLRYEINISCPWPSPTFPLSNAFSHIRAFQLLASVDLTLHHHGLWCLTVLFSKKYDFVSELWLFLKVPQVCPTLVWIAQSTQIFHTVLAVLYIPEANWEDLLDVFHGTQLFFPLIVRFLAAFLLSPRHSFLSRFWLVCTNQQWLIKIIHARLRWDLSVWASVIREHILCVFPIRRFSHVCCMCSMSRADIRSWWLTRIYGLSPDSSVPCRVWRLRSDLALKSVRGYGLFHLFSPWANSQNPGFLPLSVSLRIISLLFWFVSPSLCPPCVLSFASTVCSSPPRCLYICPQIAVSHRANGIPCCLPKVVDVVHEKKCLQRFNFHLKRDVWYTLFLGDVCSQLCEALEASISTFGWW